MVGAGIALAEGSESAAMNDMGIEERMDAVRGAVDEILTNYLYRESARALAMEIAHADSPTQQVNRPTMNP